MPIAISLLAIAAVSSGMVYTASAKLHYVYIGLAAVMALFLAFAAWRNTSAELAGGANSSKVAAINAVHMGLVFSWGALAIGLTYWLVLEWKEWLSFLAGFIGLAAVSFVFAWLLDNEGAKRLSLGKEANAGDMAILTWAQYLSYALLAGMIITMIGLVIDGKMTRFLTPRYTDWAGNLLFFFGALSLALISLQGIRANTTAAAKAPSAHSD